MSQKNKPQPAKLGELLKLTNGMIDGFNRNQSILKLRNLKGLRADLRYKIYRLAETISNSPESKALGKTIEELINNHTKKQEKLDPKERTVLQTSDPGIQDVFNMESGLEINKLVIPTNQLSDEFTPYDMSACTWIIEFEE